MRPEIMTAPPRRLLVRAVYEEPDDEVTGQKHDRAVTLRILLDLATITAVREVADYDTGGPLEGHCYVYATQRRVWALSEPFERVTEAWAAWQDHAGALHRIRN